MSANSDALENFLRELGFTAQDFFAVIKKTFRGKKTVRSRPDVIDERFTGVEVMDSITRETLRIKPDTPAMTYVSYGQCYGLWADSYQSNGANKICLRVNKVDYVAHLGATDLAKPSKKGHGPDADEPDGKS
jgi:hypothetical protein